MAEFDSMDISNQTKMLLGILHEISNKLDLNNALLTNLTGTNREIMNFTEPTKEVADKLEEIVKQSESAKELIEQINQMNRDGGN